MSLSTKIFNFQDIVHKTRFYSSFTPQVNDTNYEDFGAFELSKPSVELGETQGLVHTTSIVTDYPIGSILEPVINPVVRLNCRLCDASKLSDWELARFIYVRETKRFDPFKISIYAWCIKIAIAGSLAPVRLAWVPFLIMPKHGFIYVEADAKKTLCTIVA